MEPEPILPTPREMPAAMNPDMMQMPAGTHSNQEIRPANQERVVGLSPATATPVQAMSAVVPDDVSATTPQSVQPASDSPAIADDVEVIEKEWVDKAKKIVSATRDNPHAQEKEVNKLQADYLMKRYGKQIKLVD